MKRYVATALLAVSLVGSFANAAYEGTLNFSEDGTVSVVPLNGNCDIPQPASDETGIMHACTPTGRGCPEGYYEVAKYCWGGWHQGFYRCGLACHKRGSDGGGDGGGSGGGGCGGGGAGAR